MNKFNILVTAPYSTESLTELRLNSNIELYFSETDKPTIEELKDINGLLIRSRTVIDKELLENSPHLKVIITATSGLDHIDIEKCKLKNITVKNTPEANAQSAAEHTLLLLLSMAKNLNSAQENIKENLWRDHLTKGFELRGKHLGILGLGRVGSRVAQLAQAFGMQVSAYDPYISQDRFKELNVEPLGFTELLIQSQIISLHVPLNSETHHIINRQTLSFLSPETFIINTSRGPVIDEYELSEALRTGKIKGAALDVFEKEPLPQSSNLKTQANVILTPHQGAHTLESHKNASMEAAQLILDFIGLERIEDGSKIVQNSSQKGSKCQQL